jgi:hydrogenase maturation protease
MSGTLIAGVGNIFLGDDGFGVEVARRLSAETLPPEVQVADFGIRGVHLAYELLEGYDTLILVDALARGDEPGTVYVVEPNLENGTDDVVSDAHSLDPRAVLAMVKSFGGELSRVVVVGCEPADLVEKIGLSDPVHNAVDEAVRVVRDLVAPMLETHSAEKET